MNKTKFKNKWICLDCKKEMYVLKYKKIKNLFGMDIKEGVCYYCKSENYKWIGEELGVFEK